MAYTKLWTQPQADNKEMDFATIIDNFDEFKKDLISTLQKEYCKRA